MLLYTNPPSKVFNLADLIDQGLATAMHSLIVNVNTKLKRSPVFLVFGRDVFLDIPLIYDWQMIQQHRQTLVNEILSQWNQTRRRFYYIQGKRVLSSKIPSQ